MWIATTHGFFSAVADKKPGYLKVRARCEEDIRALHRIIPEAPEPVEWAGTDYRWRMLLTEEQWQTALMYFALEVPQYTNFKNAVKSPAHKRAYSAVWHSLLDHLQDGKMWEDDWTPRESVIGWNEAIRPKTARQSAAAFMETSQSWDAMGDLDDAYLLEQLDNMSEEEWADLMSEEP